MDKDIDKAMDEDEDDELSEESQDMCNVVYRDFELFKRTGIRPDYAPKLGELKGNDLREYFNDIANGREGFI